MKRLILIMITGVFIFLLPYGAEARSSRQLTYRYNQIWNTTVRFLRIDKHFPIIEQDKKSGYVLFEYRDASTPCPGSLELIPIVKNGKMYIRADLRIQSQPTYVEVVLIKKLLRKLKDEYGEPPLAKVVKSAKSKSKRYKNQGTTNTQMNSDEPPENERDIEVTEETLEESQEE